MMTALATALEIVPLAGPATSPAIEYPMAIVILGGLVTSTLLNLFIIPSLYLKFGKSRHEVRELQLAGRDAADSPAPA